MKYINLKLFWKEIKSVLEIVEKSKYFFHSYVVMKKISKIFLNQNLFKNQPKNNFKLFDFYNLPINILAEIIAFENQPNNLYSYDDYFCFFDFQSIDSPGYNGTDAWKGNFFSLDKEKQKKLLIYWKNRSSKIKENFFLKLHYLNLYFYLGYEVDKNNFKKLQKKFKLSLKKIIDLSLNEVCLMKENFVFIKAKKDKFSFYEVCQFWFLHSNKETFSEKQKIFKKIFNQNLFSQKLQNFKRALYLSNMFYGKDENPQLKKMAEFFLLEKNLRKYSFYLMENRSYVAFYCVKNFCLGDDIHYSSSLRFAIFCWVYIDVKTRIFSMANDLYKNTEEVLKKLNLKFKISNNEINRFNPGYKKSLFVKESKIKFEKNYFLAIETIFLDSSHKKHFKIWKKEIEKIFLILLKQKELEKWNCNYYQQILIFFWESLSLVFINENKNFINNYSFFLEKIIEPFQKKLKNFYKKCNQHAGKLNLNFLTKIAKDSNFWPFPWIKYKNTAYINYGTSDAYGVSIKTDNFYSFSLLGETINEKIKNISNHPFGIFNFFFIKLNSKKNISLNIKKNFFLSLSLYGKILLLPDQIYFFRNIVAYQTKELEIFIKNKNILNSLDEIWKFFQQKDFCKNKYYFSYLKQAILKLINKKYFDSSILFIDFFEHLIKDFSYLNSKIEIFNKSKNSQKNFNFEENSSGHLIINIKERLEEKIKKKKKTTLLEKKMFFFICQLEFLFSNKKLNSRNLFKHRELLNSIHMNNKDSFRQNIWIENDHRLVYWFFQTATQLLNFTEKNWIIF